jgi:ribosomal protein S14
MVQKKKVNKFSLGEHSCKECGRPSGNYIYCHVCWRYLSEKREKSEVKK